ncbi:MAG: glycosyltransferase family 4 protein [Candidatus Omnitrophica bacterium]|nr:glycosyltransferase family 4 protein [Candidatus Omnitrophota bacterium]
MVKILRIITRLNIGGPAIHSILLSSSLNGNGYKDTLVCGTVSKSEGDMGYLAKDYGVEPVVVPEMGREISLKNDLKTFLKLYSIMRSEKPDIVHTHTAKAGALGRLAAIFAGVPIKIHTFHGHVFDGYFSPLKARIFVCVEKFLALYTDRVITVSEAVRNDLINRLRVAEERKSVVIPLGLDLGRFLECDKNRGWFRKRLGVDDKVMLIGIVGRLVPIKNHKMFLKAARSVLNERPGADIRFVVVGDGELNQFLKEEAKAIGLEHHVIFTGWIEDLASVYSDLDLLVLTSLNEGTPVSLIEAMASAKPVIATAVGGVVDLVKDGYNGLLADSNDHADLARKIIRLMDDRSGRLAMGAHGRESVRTKYSKSRLAADIMKLYEECLEEKHKG